MESQQDRSRTGFINKGKDSESALLDIGVRKYDSEIGRFTSCDPLAEKYYSLTPYQYSANNPVGFKDADGFAVKAAGLLEQKIILQSIEKKYREYVNFDDNGLAVINSMPLKTDKNSNFMALSELVSMKETIEISMGDVADIVKSNSKESINYAIGGFGRKGWGIFLPPNTEIDFGDDSPKSQTSNAVIKISQHRKGDDKKETYARTLCEELYGHALFYFKGLDWKHNYKRYKNGYEVRDSQGKAIDKNSKLNEAIIKAQKNIGE